MPKMPGHPKPVKRDPAEILLPDDPNVAGSPREQERRFNRLVRAFMSLFCSLIPIRSNPRILDFGRAVAWVDDTQHANIIRLCRYCVAAWVIRIAISRFHDVSIAQDLRRCLRDTPELPHVKVTVVPGEMLETARWLPAVLTRSLGELEWVDAPSFAIDVRGVAGGYGWSKAADEHYEAARQTEELFRERRRQARSQARAGARSDSNQSAALRVAA